MYQYISICIIITAFQAVKASSVARSFTFLQSCGPFLQNSGLFNRLVGFFKQNSAHFSCLWLLKQKLVDLFGKNCENGVLQHPDYRLSFVHKENVCLIDHP